MRTIVSSVNDIFAAALLEELRANRHRLGGRVRVGRVVAGDRHLLKGLRARRRLLPVHRRRAAAVGVALAGAVLAAIAVTPLGHQLVLFRVGQRRVLERALSAKK